MRNLKRMLAILLVLSMLPTYALAAGDLAPGAGDKVTPGGSISATSCVGDADTRYNVAYAFHIVEAGKVTISDLGDSKLSVKVTTDTVEPLTHKTNAPLVWKSGKYIYPTLFVPAGQTLDYYIASHESAETSASVTALSGNQYTTYSNSGPTTVSGTDYALLWLSGLFPGKSNVQVGLPEMDSRISSIKALFGKDDASDYVFAARAHIATLCNSMGTQTFTRATNRDTISDGAPGKIVTWWNQYKNVIATGTGDYAVRVKDFYGQSALSESNKGFYAHLALLVNVAMCYPETDTRCEMLSKIAKMYNDIINGRETTWLVPEVELCTLGQIQDGTNKMTWWPVTGFLYYKKLISDTGAAGACVGTGVHDCSKYLMDADISYANDVKTRYTGWRNYTQTASGKVYDHQTWKSAETGYVQYPGSYWLSAINTSLSTHKGFLGIGYLGAVEGDFDVPEPTPVITEDLDGYMEVVAIPGGIFIPEIQSDKHRIVLDAPGETTEQITFKYGITFNGNGSVTSSEYSKHITSADGTPTDIKETGGGSQEVPTSSIVDVLDALIQRSEQEWALADGSTRKLEDPLKTVLTGYGAWADSQPSSWLMYRIFTICAPKLGAQGYSTADAYEQGINEAITRGYNYSGSGGDACDRFLASGERETIATNTLADQKMSGLQPARASEEGRYTALELGRQYASAVKAMWLEWASKHGGGVLTSAVNHIVIQENPNGQPGVSVAYAMTTAELKAVIEAIKKDGESSPGNPFDAIVEITMSVPFKVEDENGFDCFVIGGGGDVYLRNFAAKLSGDGHSVIQSAKYQYKPMQCRSKWDASIASCKPLENDIFYNSIVPSNTDGDVYAEFKQGDIYNEQFDSMLGTPTYTDTSSRSDFTGAYSGYKSQGHFLQYFAVGGKEFVVQFKGSYKKDQTATRTFNYTLSSVDCGSNTGTCPKVCGGHTVGSGEDAHTETRPGCDCACPHILHTDHGKHYMSGSASATVTYTGLCYIQIDDLRVWQLDEAHIEGGDLQKMIGSSSAHAANDQIGVSWNIAGANNSASGRMVYEWHPEWNDSHTFSGSMKSGCGTDGTQMKEFIDKSMNGAKAGAWCVSDYIVLHTSMGDQSILYHEYKSKEWGSALVKSTSGSSGGSSVGTTTAGGSVTFNTCSFETKTKQDLWDSNPFTSKGAGYDENSLTHGGYSGKYNSTSTKYNSYDGKCNMTNWAGTQAAQNKSGSFKHNFCNSNNKAKGIFRLINNSLQLSDSLTNGDYDTGKASVWYWNCVNETRDAAKRPPSIAGVGTDGRFQNNGFAVYNVPYAPSGAYDDKINDIVVYNPSSTEYAVLVSLPSERDQRYNQDSNVPDPITFGCPGDETCEFLQLDCDITEHLHNESCYSTYTTTVHTGLNTHVHTADCHINGTYGIWTSNSHYSSHSITGYKTNIRGYECVITADGWAYMFGSECSRSSNITQYGTSFPLASYYSYSTDYNGTSGHRDIQWRFKSPVGVYSCNNLPLNKHSCIVTTTATINGSASQTYTGNGSTTLQPGTYNIALAGGRGGGGNGGYGGTVTGTITITAPTVISWGNDGGGSGRDGNGGNAAWIAYGNYSRLSAVPVGNLIAVAGGGGSGNSGGGVGGGPNQPGGNGAAQCGGYGEGGQLNRGGNGGHDARAGGYGYGGDGNCTYGCTGNEENGGGGGYYGGGGGGHDCTSYNDFDDGDGGGGSGYANTSKLSNIGGASGQNSGSSYVKFTGGTTTKDAGCYKVGRTQLICSDPHHTFNYNWKLYTYGMMHADGKVCTGRSCNDTTDIINVSGERIKLADLAVGNIVRHSDGTVHVSTAGSGKCSLCGKSVGTVLHTAMPTDRTDHMACLDPNHNPNDPGHKCTYEWEHYEYGDMRCYKACHDDSKHKAQTITVDSAGVTAGTFVNLDYPFTIEFPNTGDHRGTGRFGSSDISAERGKGYYNGMDDTIWTKYKWVEFPFAVWDKTTNQSYSPGERIYLNVPQTRFEFYCMLGNQEVPSAIIRFGSTAINDPTPTYLENNKVLNNTLTRDIQHGDMYGHMHDTYKEFYVDVVGRIGALTMNDTGDFRYSNFFKRTMEGWLVPNVLHRVNTAQQRYILTDPKDVRGIDLGQTTISGYSTNPVHTNTYGTWPASNDETKWRNITDSSLEKRFPLVPSYLKEAVSAPLSSNQSAVSTQPMRVGYNAYMDFSTLGNYYGINEKDEFGNAILNYCTVNIHYFKIDVNTGALTSADAYMLKDGKYILVNDADATINLTPDTPTDQSSNLNWVEEANRRNFFTAERLATDRVFDTYKVGKPGGATWYYGTYDTLNLLGRNRTSIGTEYTYGVNTDPGNNTYPGDSNGVWANTLAELQGARWHFSVGLPSSTVFVKSGDPCDEAHIKSFAGTDGSTAIAVALEIYAKGQVWNLIYDGKNINTNAFQVTPDTPALPVHPHYPETPGQDPTKPGTPVRDEEMPVVAIISINHSSKEDIDQAGSH